jgi:hypothetical protein
MSCESDGFYNEVERTTRHVAKKQHGCCACDDPIRPGDVYEYTFTKFEGEVSTFKHCLRCATLFHAIARRQREQGLDVGVQFDLGCGHSWEETFDEDPPPEIARLAFFTPEEAQRELASR